MELLSDFGVAQASRALERNQHLVHRRALRPPRLARVVAISLGLAMLTPARSASAGDPSLAEKLFQEGRTLLAAGEFAAACTRFRESNAAEPSVGALANLALCRTKEGKTASAWRAYLDAATLAKSTGDAERERDAANEARQLEPDLARLTISVTDPPAGLVVKRDGEPMPAAQLGRAVPLDPGQYALEASAPNASTWSTTVTIGAARDHQTVQIPALAELDSGGGLEMAGWIVGGIGVAALGVGAATGILAMQENDALRSDPSLCPDARGNQCQSLEASDRLSSLETMATVSTVSIGVGAAATVAGVVLLVMAPSAASSDGPPSAGTWLVAPILDARAAGVAFAATF